ncbi:MAG TPA: ATP synthase F1 subunit epsilon [Thermoanaerobaculia bacterium]|nr:ATP synthase F1 subunit epsilon [Thermoanaerobaculia bacterium]
MAEPNASGRLHLVVVSRDHKLLEVDCDEVSLPGREGDLGILPGHAALICTLRPGELSYRLGSRVERAAIAAGFCQVFGDVVTVLVDRAQLPSEIDAQAAAETLRELEKRLPFATPEELDALQDRLREVEAQMAVTRSR